MADLPARELWSRIERYLYLPAKEPENDAAEADDGLAPLLSRYCRAGRLTAYQAEQIKVGRLGRLRVGNYRILEPLGAERDDGGVFLAEHIHLGQWAAVRIAAGATLLNGGNFAELCRRVAKVRQLQQEQIVAADDLGVLVPAEYGAAGWYVASPYVAGEDLERLLRLEGSWPLARVTGLVEQLARILTTAHRQDLAHGCLRLGSIRIRPDGALCVVDFGLCPLQSSSRDAMRADLQALGRIMYSCLTGAEAPAQGASLTWPAGIPPLLREICRGLLADEGRGPPIGTAGDLLLLLQPQHATAPVTLPQIPAVAEGQRVLVVDDEQAVRSLCVVVLNRVGMHCEQAVDGLQALETFRTRPTDLVLLDIDMPRLNGLDACRQLRRLGTRHHLKILLMSGRSDPDVLASMLLAGADDYLIKPFTPVQLQARAQAALRLQTAQERSDGLASKLLALNHELETHLQARDSDLVEARNALVLALAKLVESRDLETGAHLLRLQAFSRRLAEEALADATFAGQLDQNFIDLLACCAPLHDIGKVGLPDHILLKPGKLDPDERQLMEAHTVIGAATLQEVARQHGFALVFLQMAVDITRHHHERYDGLGYPDHLAGTAIPLAARIVAICDVYDALRSRRVYKPPMPHDEVVAMMRKQAGTQFDPDLLACFERCADDFGRLYRDLSASDAAE